MHMVDIKNSSGIPLQVTNSLSKSDKLIKRERQYHTMSFIYKTLYTNEIIYFAYDEPYTYS